MIRRILALLAFALLLFPADARGAVTWVAAHRELVTFGSLVVEDDAAGQFRVDRDDFEEFGPYEGFIATALDSEGTFVASFARQTSTVGSGVATLAGDFASNGEVGGTGIMAEGFGVSQVLADFTLDAPTAIVIEGVLAATGNGTSTVELTRDGGALVFRDQVDDGSAPIQRSQPLEPGAYRLLAQSGGYGRQFAGHPVSPSTGSFSLSARFEDATTSASAAPPARFALAQNHPNPLSRGTSIGFDLASDSPVRLEVFDLTGRRVRVIADRAFAAGAHRETWDRTDAHGSRVPAGVYLYRLTAGADRAERKMAVLGD